MAKFNPDVQVSNENNYINASQGQTPNKALGLLFSGLADTIEVGMQDKMNRDSLALERAAQGEIEKFNNDVIGDVSDPSLFTTAAPKAAPKIGTAAREPDDTPVALKQAQGTVDRLKQAYEQGKLSEAYFTQRTMQLSKSLHAQFPHLSDKVDDVIAGAIGSSTANQMRKEVNNILQQESATASSEEKRKRALLASNKEYLADPYVMSVYEKAAKKPFSMDDFNENAFLYAVSVREVQDKDVARQKASIELAGADIGLKTKLAKSSAIKEATILRDRLLFTTLAPDGVDTRLQFGELTSLVNTASADGDVTPEETEAIEKLLGSVEMTLKNRADQLLTGMDENGNSYAQYITDQNDRNDVLAVFMGPLTTIREAVSNNHTGILGAVKRSVEAQQAYYDNKMLQKYGGLTSVIAEAKKQLGPEAVEKAYRQITQDSTLRQIDPKSEEYAVAEKLLGMLMAGESPTETLKQGVADGSITSGPAANAALNIYLGMISGPTATKESKVKAAKTLFSERENGLLESFTRNNPEDLWNAIMNPALLEDIKGTEAYSAAYTWGMYQARVLLKPLADQIYEAQAFTDTAGITYNRAIKRFEYRNEGTVAGGLARGPLVNNYDRYQASKGNEAVGKMNRLLDKMQPVIEGNGDSIESFLGTVFTGRDFKSIQKEGSIITRMRDTFFKSLQEDMKSPSVKEGGGSTEPPKLNPNPPRPDLKSEAPTSRSIVGASRTTEEVNVVEAYKNPGKARRGDPSGKIRSIGVAAAQAIGMDKLIITSGKGNYISPSGKKRGQKTTQHATGKAMDVGGFSSEEQMFQFIEEAVANGANGVGIYGNGTVHIDYGKPRSWNWAGDDVALKRVIQRGMKRRDLASK